MNVSGGNTESTKCVPHPWHITPHLPPVFTDLLPPFAFIFLCVRETERPKAKRMQLRGCPTKDPGTPQRP